MKTPLRRAVIFGRAIQSEKSLDEGDSFLEQQKKLQNMGKNVFVTKS